MAETQKVRAATRDVAYGFRMPQGIAGDVNRTHPFSVTPETHDATNPVAQFGFPCTVNTVAGTVRGFIASDTAATKIHGIVVRPYPTQSTANDFGVGAPGAGGFVDVLRAGFIFVKLPTGSTAPVKEGAVHVWIAASAGANVQGGIVSAASAGNTVTITNARFVGGMDATNVAEIEIFRA